MVSVSTLFSIPLFEGHIFESNAFLLGPVIVSDKDSFGLLFKTTNGVNFLCIVEVV